MTSHFDLTRFYDVIICNSVFYLGFLTREFQIPKESCCFSIKLILKKKICNRPGEDFSGHLHFLKQKYFSFWPYFNILLDSSTFLSESIYSVNETSGFCMIGVLSQKAFPKKLQYNDKYLSRITLATLDLRIQGGGSESSRFLQNTQFCKIVMYCE